MVKDMRSLPETIEFPEARASSANFYHNSSTALSQVSHTFIVLQCTAAKTTNKRKRPEIEVGSIHHSVAGPDMSVKTLNRTICGIALIALSGCAAPPPAPPRPATPPVAQDTASTGPVALVPPPSSAPAKAAPVKHHDDRKATAAVATAPAPASLAPPVRLVGMDEGSVQALLGTPSAVEDHAPGKTWRFRKQTCVLSLALYPDVQTRVFRTLSYEVTSDEHNAGAKQLCETKFGGVATPD